MDTKINTVGSTTSTILDGSVTVTTSAPIKVGSPETFKPNQAWQQVPDKCVRGLATFEDADQLRKLTVAGLKKAKQADAYQVKVRRRPDWTFDMLVFKRIGGKEA